MASDIHTTTVNRRGKFFRLEDGTVLEFIAMLSHDCKPTDSPNECVIAIYRLSDGRYKGADLHLFRDEERDDVAYLEYLARAMSGDIECTAINRRGMFFRLEDDTTIEFAAMLNINCEPTDNPDDCIVAVYKLPDGLFRAVDLRILYDHDDMWEVTQ